MSPKSDLSSGYVSSGGAKLYFETAGEGAALIFIHAGISDSRMWDPQFEEFARDFHIIRYDFRGFGRSSLPPPTQHVQAHSRRRTRPPPGWRRMEDVELSSKGCGPSLVRPHGKFVPRRITVLE